MYYYYYFEVYNHFFYFDICMNIITKLQMLYSGNLQASHEKQTEKYVWKQNTSEKNVFISEVFFPNKHLCTKL